MCGQVALFFPPPRKQFKVVRAGDKSLPHSLTFFFFLFFSKKSTKGRGGQRICFCHLHCFPPSSPPPLPPPPLFPFFLSPPKIGQGRRAREKALSLSPTFFLFFFRLCSFQICLFLFFLKKSIRLGGQGISLPAADTVIVLFWFLKQYKVGGPGDKSASCRHSDHLWQWFQSSNGPASTGQVQKRAKKENENWQWLKKEREKKIDYPWQWSKRGGGEVKQLDYVSDFKPSNGPARVEEVLKKRGKRTRKNKEKHNQQKMWLSSYDSDF